MQDGSLAPYYLTARYLTVYAATHDSARPPLANQSSTLFNHMFRSARLKHVERYRNFRRYGVRVATLQSIRGESLAVTDPAVTG